MHSFSMASQQLLDLIKNAKNLIEHNGDDYQYADALFQYGRYAIQTEKEIDLGLELLNDAKEMAERIVADITHGNIWMLDRYCMDNDVEYEIMNLYYDILKEESYYNLESFMFYMERRRPQEKRFYLPRRKSLKVVADDLMELEMGDLKFYGLSMPSRVGKSTICIFFLAWVALRKPNSHSAMGGHSGILAKGFYKELMNLFTTEEYTFAELFEYFHPGKVILRDKSADEFTITLDQPDRFATITCRGIDGTWTGAVDISGGDNAGYLYVDDLVRDREHSLSPTRMENTFQEYLNKMVDRKNDGAKELMVGTLWSVLDPLSRIEKIYKDNPLYRFRKIPALDENDESNFDYDVAGFSTAYYHEMRQKLDNAEWQAKFMQAPFIREGLVLPLDELRYFNGILPPGDSRVVAVTDVALGGGDNLSMPIGREYPNGDVYIFDWVFNKGVKEITIPIVVGKIISNEIRQTRFEANQGGDLYCAWVDAELRKQGYKCSCTHKRAPNSMEKMSKIIAYSGDVKRKFIFLQSQKPTAEEIQQDAELGIKRYVRSEEYQKAMEELGMTVSVGKNEHEDAADSIVQLEMFIEGDGIATVEAMKNPFAKW